jgi:hypothetical protein
VFYKDKYKKQNTFLVDYMHSWGHGTMLGENQQLITNEPVKVQDSRKITNHFRGIYRIYPNLIEENWRM